MSQNNLTILWLFLLDFRPYNHGLTGPQKANSCCDNSSFGILSFTPILTVRSGPVWRQDLAILSPEAPRDSTCQLRSEKVWGRVGGGFLIWLSPHRLFMFMALFLLPIEGSEGVKKSRIIFSGFCVALLSGISVKRGHYQVPLEILRQVPGCTKSMCAPSCELWRTLMKFGELWRTHNNTFTRTSVTFTRVPAKVPRIHQSSGEGAFCIWVAFRMCPKFKIFAPPSPGFRDLTPHIPISKLCV